MTMTRTRGVSIQKTHLRKLSYVPSAGEKLTANVSGEQPSLNISGEVKELEFKKSETAPSQFNIVFNNYAPNSFNPVITSNQSIFQYYSIEYILTFTIQQNISIECKTILQTQIKNFEQECKKEQSGSRKIKIHSQLCLSYSKGRGIDACKIWFG